MVRHTSGCLCDIFGQSEKKRGEFKFQMRARERDGGTLSSFPEKLQVLICGELYIEI